MKLNSFNLDSKIDWKIIKFTTFQAPRTKACVLILVQVFLHRKCRHVFEQIQNTIFRVLFLWPMIFNKLFYLFKKNFFLFFLFLLNAYTKYHFLSQTALILLLCLDQASFFFEDKRMFALILDYGCLICLNTSLIIFLASVWFAIFTAFTYSWINNTREFLVLILRFDKLWYSSKLTFSARRFCEFFLQTLCRSVIRFRCDSKK